MLSAVMLDQAAEHLGVVRDGVEEKFLQVSRRLALDDGLGVGARTPGVVHARPVVRDVAAPMRHQHLQLRMPCHHAVEDQVRHRHRRLQRVADDVVEVVVRQPVGLGVAQRVHEDQHAELLAAGEKGLQPQAGVGQVLAVDVGADFHALEIQRLDRVIQFAHREFGVLQGHRAQADKTVGRVGDDLRDALVDLARQFGTVIGFGEVEEVVGRRAHGLDVDAHAVHVLQPLGDTAELRRAGGHLLDVGLPRQLVGEDHRRVVLRGIQVCGLGVDLRVQVMAVQIDDLAAALAGLDDRPRGGGFAPCHGGCGRPCAVPVGGVGAVRRAGVEHAVSPGFEGRSASLIGVMERADGAS